MSAVASESLPRLRPMRDDDLRQVIAIELAAYEFPWTLGIFRDCLRFGYTSRVLARDHDILGYGLLSTGAGECHLLNICVAPPHQGRGLGSWMIERLLEIAREQGAQIAFLEVRASNRAAYHVYGKLGFNEIGVRKNYYPARDGREDALLLARDL
jgi:ribosomal-protein-alanine N-acetyltransferase